MSKLINLKNWKIEDVIIINFFKKSSFIQQKVQDLVIRNLSIFQ